MKKTLILLFGFILLTNIINVQAAKLPEIVVSSCSMKAQMHGDLIVDHYHKKVINNNQGFVGADGGCGTIILTPEQIANFPGYALIDFQSIYPYSVCKLFTEEYTNKEFGIIANLECSHFSPQMNTYIYITHIIQVNLDNNELLLIRVYHMNEIDTGESILNNNDT